MKEIFDMKEKLYQKNFSTFYNELGRRNIEFSTAAWGANDKKRTFPYRKCADNFTFVVVAPAFPVAGSPYDDSAEDPMDGAKTIQSFADINLAPFTCKNSKGHTGVIDFVVTTTTVALKKRDDASKYAIDLEVPVTLTAWDAMNNDMAVAVVNPKLAYSDDDESDWSIRKDREKLKITFTDGSKFKPANGETPVMVTVESEKRMVFEPGKVVFSLKIQVNDEDTPRFDHICGDFICNAAVYNPRSKKSALKQLPETFPNDKRIRLTPTEKEAADARWFNEVKQRDINEFDTTPIPPNTEDAASEVDEPNIVEEVDDFSMDEDAEAETSASASASASASTNTPTSANASASASVDEDAEMEDPEEDDDVIIENSEDDDPKHPAFSQKNFDSFRRKETKARRKETKANAKARAEKNKLLREDLHANLKEYFSPIAEEYDAFCSASHYAYPTNRSGAMQYAAKKLKWITHDQITELQTLGNRLGGRLTRFAVISNLKLIRTNRFYFNQKDRTRKAEVRRRQKEEKKEGTKSGKKSGPGAGEDPWSQFDRSSFPTSSNSSKSAPSTSSDSYPPFDPDFARTNFAPSASSSASASSKSAPSTSSDSYPPFDPDFARTNFAPSASSSASASSKSAPSSSSSSTSSKSAPSASSKSAPSNSAPSSSSSSTSSKSAPSASSSSSTSSNSAPSSSSSKNPDGNPNKPMPEQSTNNTLTPQQASDVERFSNTIEELVDTQSIRDACVWCLDNFPDLSIFPNIKAINSLKKSDATDVSMVKKMFILLHPDKINTRTQDIYLRTLSLEITKRLSAMLNQAQDRFDDEEDDRFDDEEDDDIIIDDD